jgi:hypothetical protein
MGRVTLVSATTPVDLDGVDVRFTPYRVGDPVAAMIAEPFAADVQRKFGQGGDVLRPLTGTGAYREMGPRRFESGLRSSTPPPPGSRRWSRVRIPSSDLERPQVESYFPCVPFAVRTGGLNGRGRATPVQTVHSCRMRHAQTYESLIAGSP